MDSKAQNIPTSQHPLLNHLVLENVFGYLKHNNLKTARLVSNFWNTTSAGKIQETSQVHLTPENLSDYLQLFLHSKIQNKKFHLHGFHIKLDSNIAEPLSTFLSKFGSNIKEIVFSKCKFSAEKFWEIFTFLQELEIVSFGESLILSGNQSDQGESLQLQQNINVLSCPKVTSLEIIAAPKGSLPPFSDIFRHFLGIKSLQVQFQKSDDLTEMLAALANPQPRIQLTDFCSYIQLQENHVQHLLDLSSNLSSIDIFLDQSVTPELVAHFLRGCSNTLKTLKLSRGVAGGVLENVEPSPKFPYNITFNKLTNLEINNGMMESLKCLPSTPNLKNLFVLQDDVEEDDILFSQLIQNCASNNNNLEFQSPKVEVFSMQYFLTNSCLRRLGEKLCPNIKKLSLYLDDESIRGVYSHFMNLEELWVCGTEVTDEGITGIPFHALLDESISKKEAYREFPYIGQCLKLKKFGVYSQPQENISDFSVHFGLLDVKELTSLDLPQTAITDEGIRTLSGNSRIVNLQAKYFVEDGTLSERCEDLQKF